jgi:TPR repeat protein
VNHAFVYPQVTTMKRTALTLILLLLSTVATGGNDIWQSLFNEKLQEARQGNSSAQFDVASMYQNGRGVTPDLSKAIEWYKKSAAQNNLKAVNRLKILEANEERFKKVLALADEGDAENQYKLGKMYTEGAGTSINHDKAAEAFENAAKQGYAKAEYKLGLNYYEGTGVNRNSKTAYKWFKAAAEQNHPASQYYLGKMYASGSGVKQNYTTSLEWYSRAADGGFNQARGEMIDVSEKMNMEKAENNKPAAMKKVVVKKKKSVARASKPKSKKVKTETAKIKKPEKTPEFSIEDLMVAAWNRDNKPVTYLPSAINNCRTEKSNIACYSDSQTRKSGNSIIKFNTKSIIKGFSKDGTFKVTYRNLVVDSGAIDHIDSSKDDEEVGSEDDNAGSTYKVKAGWGKKHSLECQLKDSGTVSCLKNKTHAFILVSPHTLVSGK